LGTDATDRKESPNNKHTHETLDRCVGHATLVDMPRYTPAQRRLTRIESQLQGLIGEGPTALFRDARRLADDGFGLESQAALIWHCGREIESAIHAALNPMAPFDAKANKRRMRAGQVEAIIQQLELPVADPAIVWWKKAKLHGLAHRPNLGPPRSFTPGDWDTFLSALELILGAFEARYQRMIDRLDALLAMTPAQAGEEAGRLLCIVPPTGQATALQHFFRRADARWLAALPACILKNPPGRLYLPNPPGGYNFPRWHASEYLAKVAPDRPAEVSDRAMSILSRKPENPWIHRDFTAAAEHFTPVMMARWAKIEAAWVSAQPWLDFLMFIGFVKAVPRLVAAGLHSEAFTLGQAVLALGTGPSRRYGEPALRTDVHEYGQALETILPSLVAVDARRTSRFLNDLVDKAVEQANTETRAKWSLMWRSSIADDGTNDTDNVIDKMIDGLRDALEAAGVDQRALKGLSEMLIRHGPSSSVFLRLAIHLVTAGRKVAPALAKEALLNPATYINDTWVEAHRLVEAAGPSLGDDEISATIVVIRASSLDDGHQDELVALLEGLRIGAVPEPIVGQPMFRTYPYVPPPSPVSAEQLGRWSIPRTVRFLTQWQTAQHRDGDMLKFAFLEAVKANPERWSDAGVKVVGLPADFLSRYFWGLREAAKEGATLNGNALARLFEAGLVTGRSWLTDDYQDVRRSVAWILRDVLNADQIRLSSPTSRDALWAVVGALLKDPSPVSMTTSGGDVDDLASGALNHSRSISTTLVIAYALWRNRQRPGTRRLPTEARLLLEARLDPTETSAFVRFAIGEQLVVLRWMDPVWTAGALPRIFPHDESQAPLRDAAWRGYLWRGNVPLDLFRALLPEYRHSLDGLEPTGEMTRAHQRLAEHVLLLARIGTIGPESDDGLLPLLFSHASADLAREAIHDLGWALWNARQQEADPEEVARLRVFWDWLSVEVQAGRASPSSLEPFGWWFASAKLDQEWSLDELERLAHADIEIDYMNVVFERLLTLAPRDPARIGRVTDAIVASEFRSEALYSDELRGTVRLLVDAGSGPDANAYGNAIISRMVSRGFATFPGS
jgi:hypothetical protein